MSARMIYFFAALLSIGCGSSDSPAKSDAPASFSAEQKSAGPRSLTSIQWIDSVKTLGRINEGQKVEVSFRFRNSGSKPLIIESVQPSCGCTVANYPKEPISPGGEGEITGTFDSHGREGLQHKELTVKANTTTGEERIYFEVEVQKKPNTGNTEDPGNP